MKDLKDCLIEAINEGKKVNSITLNCFYPKLWLELKTIFQQNLFITKRLDELKKESEKLIRSFLKEEGIVYSDFEKTHINMVIFELRGKVQIDGDELYSFVEEGLTNKFKNDIMIDYTNGDLCLMMKFEGKKRMMLRISVTDK